MAKNNGTIRIITVVIGIILFSMTVASISYSRGLKSGFNDKESLSKTVNVLDRKVAVLEANVDNILQGISRIESKLDE